VFMVLYNNIFRTDNCVFQRKSALRVGYILECVGSSVPLGNSWVSPDVERVGIGVAGGPG
jgi:SNF family Na+-dependent transporter